MKKIIILILMLLPMYAIAAHPKIKKLSERYTDNSNVTVVDLSKDMIRMAAGDTEDLDGIEGVLIITTEIDELSKDIIKRADKILKSLKLNTIADIDNEGTKIKIYTTSGNDTAEMIIYVIDGSEVAFINISGNIPAEKMGELLGGIGAL